MYKVLRIVGKEMEKQNSIFVLTMSQRCKISLSLSLSLFLCKILFVILERLGIKVCNIRFSVTIAIIVCSKQGECIS